ncbi:Nucleotide-binding protein 2 [Cichlidogyrus casuarinus]|uniref:Nucleotide-binding protein 2 n=1 Tax=Cichlidogyrus casuarinus TaxID=1844966 RepID=A0ABD2Q9A2_9PLAT
MPTINNMFLDKILFTIQCSANTFPRDNFHLTTQMNLVSTTALTPDMKIDTIDVKPGLAGVKSIVLVLSGKGGVGKSTVATQLAVNLWKKGLKVGILDVDLCGPSIPRMMGLEDEEVYQGVQGWMPVYADKLHDKRMAVMSLSFVMPDKNVAVIWRGPRKTGMIEQLLNKLVCWGELDYLIIDTPPGTSDEHLTCIEVIQQEAASKLTGAVLVTTPQRISLCDVRREITFCQQTNLPIIGIVENMSGYLCPHCTECTRIFSQGGGEQLAKDKSLPFLGRVSIDPKLTAILDSKSDFSHKASYVSADFEKLADNITQN